MSGPDRHGRKDPWGMFGPRPLMPRADVRTPASTCH